MLSRATLWALLPFLALTPAAHAADVLISPNGNEPGRTRTDITSYVPDSQESIELQRLIDQHESIWLSLEDARSRIGANSPQILQLRAREEMLARKLKQLSTNTVESWDKLYYVRMDDVRQLTHDVQKQTDRVDVSLDGVEASIRDLESQRQRLQLDDAVSTARNEALRDVIADVSERAKKLATEDDIVNERSSLVQIRQKQLDTEQKMQQTGTATAADVATAEAALSEAKIKLAERRKEVELANGADSVSALNAKMLDLAIEQHQRQANLKAVSAQLEKLGGALADVEKLDHLKRELSQVSAEAFKAETSRMRIERELQLAAPENDESSTTQSSGKN